MVLKVIDSVLYTFSGLSARLCSISCTRRRERRLCVPLRLGEMRFQCGLRCVCLPKRLRLPVHVPRSS